MKIINIISDEKFIDNLIDYHDLTKDYCTHKYVIITPIRKKKFVYITKSDRIDIVSTTQFNKYLKSENGDAIFIHNLTVIPPHLVYKIPSHTPVIWSSWGMDIYSYPVKNPIVSIENNYKPLTIRQLKKVNNRVSLKFISKNIKSILKNIITHQPLLSRNRTKDYIKAINRVDFFSSVLPPEYQLVKNVTNFSAKQFNYKYYNIHDFGKKYISPKKIKRIIIGNSSAPTNNHLDLFAKLRGFNFDNIEVLLPLSYGASKEWRDIILDEAIKIFKDQLKALTDFIGYEEYANLLEESSHAIFFQERQQAMGNIFYLLITGCKIFLSDTSVTYKYLRNIGVRVFSIQSELNDENLNLFLDDESANKNKQIISDLIYNKDNAINTLLSLYSQISKFHINKENNEIPKK